MDIDVNLARGARAKEILENEIYIETFDTVESELLTAWKNSPVRDVEGREKLFLMLGLLTKLKLALQSTMDTGKMAQVNLKHQQSMVDKAREFIGL